MRGVHLKKFTYLICNVPDEEIWKKQCNALLKYIPGLKKGKLYIDVDYSKIQEFFLGDKLLTVNKSEYLGDVHINSEFDIEPYFEK